MSNLDISADVMARRQETRLWMAEVAEMATTPASTVPVAELNGLLDKMLDRMNELEVCDD